MAVSSVFPTRQPSLKYLGIFGTAMNKVTQLAANIYGHAKESSGPLKPGVDTVENAVRSVVRPVYQTIEGKPYEILHFIDKQVDNVFTTVGYLPHIVKEKTSQAYGATKQLPELAKSVVFDVKDGGLERAKLFLAKIEPIAEEWVYLAWLQFLRLPFAPTFVQLTGPPTVFFAEKVNESVEFLKKKHLPLATYLPLLPVEKIEKAVKVAHQQGPYTNAAQ